MVVIGTEIAFDFDIHAWRDAEHLRVVENLEEFDCLLTREILHRAWLKRDGRRDPFRLGDALRIEVRFLVHPIHRIVVNPRVYVVFEVRILHAECELQFTCIHHKLCRRIDLTFLKDDSRTLSQKHFLDNEEQPQENHAKNRDCKNRTEFRIVCRTPTKPKQNLASE